MYNEDGTYQGCFYPVQFLYPDSDELGSKEPRILVSNLSDVYGIPDDVAAFNVVQNQKLAEFAWTPVEGIGITYEIRRGESWENSKIIVSGINTTTYSAALNVKGILKYWIKAKNKYNYSKNATGDILNVQYIPELNEIVATNIFENPKGVFDNTKLYRGKLKLKSTIKWQKLEDLWQDSGNRYYADSNNKWGTTTVNSGSYTSQIFDVGASLNNIVTFDYILYTSDELQTIIIEWRYSEDNTNWSDWIIGATGAYQFRYYQVKVTFNNPNKAMMWLSNFVMAVDVPDRKEEYTDRTIDDSTNGLIIYYETDPESIVQAPFVKEKPHVLVTPYATNAYPNVEESTKEYCRIKLYTNDGLETTGSINVTVSGY